MLKSKLFIVTATVTLAAASFLTSCVSTNTNATPASDSTSTVTSSEVSDSTIVEKNVSVVDKETIAKENEFIESIKDISIKIVSAPKIATVGNDFVRPFTIAVADGQGTALTNYPITIRYPSSKVDGELVYATENVNTDANGQFVFTAPKLTFAGCGDFAVYPTPVSDSEDVMTAVTSKAAATPWDVKSDLASKGCLLVVWDFNELDKFDRNSSQLQGELRSRGIYNVGNAPYSDSSYINKSVQTIYEANKEIVGENAYGYLIYGTIKFTTDVTPLEEGGYTCTLLGDIQALRMKDGSVALHKTIEQSAVGKNWNEVVSKCKSKLASKIADSLLYDLN